MIGLRDTWYQAAWADEIAPGGSLVRTILDTPILFWRDDAGSLSAILDRCPHRFAPLSAGSIEGNRVTCGYHALVFDGTGACVHNPHGPVTGAMKVQSFPVVERHRALWVWMGDAARADQTLIPDLGFIDEAGDEGALFGYMPAGANYRLLTDNIMDLTHADSLHLSSIGGVMTGSKFTSRADGDRVIAEWMVANCDPPPAFKPMVPPPLRGDLWTEVTWQAPAVMVLATAATPTGTPREPKDISYNLHCMSPETETSSHYFYCNTSAALIGNPEFRAYLAGALDSAFNHEDKPMLEAQQQRMGQADFWDLNPILLPIDAAAVRVRRKLDAMIENEQRQLAPQEMVEGVK